MLADEGQVKKTVLLPMTAYVSIAIEAMMQVLEARDVDLSQAAFQIEDLSLTRPLVIPDETAVNTITTLDLSKSQNKSRLPSTADFVIASRNGETAINHCSGIVKIVPGKSKSCVFTCMCMPSQQFLNQ